MVAHSKKSLMLMWSENSNMNGTYKQMKETWTCGREKCKKIEAKGINMRV